MSLPKIAIIGAGMSGLSAAHHLKGKAEVTLFDKSRGVGGRMSTRYAGDYEFDHGAQYFTAQDKSFLKAVKRGIEAGVVAPWKSRAFYLKAEGGLEVDQGRERYVAAPRMNSWPKFLAEGLDIRLGQRVSKMTRRKDGWNLMFEDKTNTSGFDAIISTIPPVQAIDILPSTFSRRKALTSAKLDVCFALMVGIRDKIDFGWDTLRVSDLPVAWIAVNSAKPGRTDGLTTIMIHADANWSERHQNADRVWVQNTLLGIASSICQHDLKSAPHIALHRWLYASIGQSADQPCLYDPKLKIAACGDWCEGGRVQGAWLSGKAAAKAVLSDIA